MSLVNVAVAAGVARIELNRPDKLNAITSGMRIELSRALADAVADDAVRVIVFGGAGRSFCAGQDVEEIRDRVVLEDARSREFRELYDALRACPKPVIARLHGHVAGAGLQMALLCDLRIAGESARIGMTEFNIGLPVFIGSHLLREVVGEAAMRRLVLYSDFVSGAEALRLGLATEVHPDAALNARIAEIAQGLAARDPDAVRRTKLGWAETTAVWFEEMMEQAGRLRGRMVPEWKK
jgi:enoyl-CoA hydratase/carnithine racemase